MRVVIAGASGFLGTHLTARLRQHGHEVTPLVRREACEARESQWDPYTGLLDQGVIDAADVVVNVAGSPLFGNPHSSRYRQQLFECLLTFADHHDVGAGVQIRFGVIRRIRTADHYSSAMLPSSGRRI